MMLLFDPGTEFEYSGPGISLLQEVIEKLTGKNLQTLAKKNIFDKEQFNMKNTNFLPPEYLNEAINEDEKHPQMLAIHSLHTTASDYARFMAGWMKDEIIWQQAIVPQTLKKRDGWANTQRISVEDQSKIAWGLGLGLQLDSDGNVTKVFHSGDMNEWRALVAIDKTSKTGIVYFGNSRNALMLADEIITPNVNIEPALKSIFAKYGFARRIEDD